MENVHLILAIFMVLSSSVLRISNATHNFVGHVGGIVNFSTRTGREENSSMEMAVGEFHNSTGCKLDLKIGNLSGSSDRAAFAAFDSIKTQQVCAIVCIPPNGSYEMVLSRQSRRRGRVYIESGLVMVVPLKTYKSEGPWVFLKPFTKGMWFSVVAISLLTGFVVWVLEHSSNEDFRGPWMQQFRNILWFSFTTLYLGRQSNSLSNLSRFVMAPWLFLILIVSATFGTSLTSMMTTSRLEPSEIDVISLEKTNAAVGYDGGILTTRYLEMVLCFKPVNIKSFVSLDDHAQALRNGVIRAGFFSIDRAIVFLAENCKDFTMVFQKDSRLASDISEAVQRLKRSGSGDLQHLEKAMVSYLKCSTSALQTDSNADKSIGVASFAGLFGLSISASAIALSIMVARFLRKRLHGIQLTFTSKEFWKQVAALVLA